MKKLMIAVVAGLMSVAFAGAYAGEGEMKKDTKSEMSKGAAKKSADTSKAGDMKAEKRKGGKKKKDEQKQQ